MKTLRRFLYALLLIRFFWAITSSGAQNQLGQPLQQAIPTLVGSPDGIIKAPPGYLVIDPETGNLYKKSTAQQLNTGWFLLSTNAASSFGSLLPGTNIVFTTNAGILKISSSTPTGGGDTIWTNSAGAIRFSPLTDYGEQIFEIPLSPTNLTAVATPTNESTFDEYYVIAKMANGSRSKSAFVFTEHAPATLNSTNFITLTWHAVAGVSSYEIWTDDREGTPNSIGLLGTTTGTNFVDNGVAGNGGDVPNDPEYSVIVGQNYWINADGGVLQGRYAESIGGYGTKGGFTSIRSVTESGGNEDLNILFLKTWKDDTGPFGHYSLARHYSGVTSQGNLLASSDTSVYNGATFDEIQHTAEPGFVFSLWFQDSTEMARIIPDAVTFDNGPNFRSKAVARTSGNIFELWNASTNEVYAEFDGTLHAKEFVVTGSAFRPEDTAGASVIFQAHDDDTPGAAGRKTFMTLLNGSVPDLTISAPSGGTVTLDATAFKAGGTSGITQTNILTIAGVITNQITVKAGIITGWIFL